MWRGKSDLDTVTQVEVLEPFRPIREDLDRFALGEVMLEACDRVVQEKEPSARVLNLLVDSLGALCLQRSPLVLASFLLKLSGEAGFGPCLDRCAGCGRPASWFSPGQGGAVCPGCRSLDAEEVGPSVLELLSDLAGPSFSHRQVIPTGALPIRPGSTPSTGDVGVAVRLARYYTEYHLERRLKSAATAEAIASR